MAPSGWKTQSYYNWMICKCNDFCVRMWYQMHRRRICCCVWQQTFAICLSRSQCRWCHYRWRWSLRTRRARRRLWRTLGTGRALAATRCYAWTANTFDRAMCSMSSSEVHSCPLIVWRRTLNLWWSWRNWWTSSRNCYTGTPQRFCSSPPPAASGRKCSLHVDWGSNFCRLAICAWKMIQTFL